MVVSLRVLLKAPHFLSATFFIVSCNLSFAQPVDFDTFYKIGSDYICGSETLECRHEVCGRDPSVGTVTEMCPGDGGLYYGVRGINHPSSRCADLGYRTIIGNYFSSQGISIATVASDVTVVSSGGTCELKHEEVWPPEPNWDSTDGNCYEYWDFGHERDRVPCVRPDFYYCQVSFQLNETCRHLECGTEPKTCPSIIFGIDDVAILTLSPFVDNERLFRNALDLISVNYQANRLSKVEAVERSDAAEEAFNDVDALREIIQEEEARGS